MAGLTPIQDSGLVRWFLDARDRGASGVLTVRPPLQDAVQITLVGGRVRHIAPDLDVLTGAGDDPGALASALEVGRDMVAERLKGLGELRDGEFTFVEDAATASVNAATGLPLEVDPAASLLRSFDHGQCDAEQAALLGRRWEDRLRPGPKHPQRIHAFKAAWPQGTVHGAIDRAQSLTELMEGVPDALPVLRRVYAAVVTGVAVLVDPAIAMAAPAEVAAGALQAELQAQLEGQLGPSPAPAPSSDAPATHEMPWNAEEDLVVTSTPMPMTVPDVATSTASALSIEQLVEAAAAEDDPWVGVSAYPDVAERVVRRDARIRSGRGEERRIRSGVSQLIRPESEDVGLNLDLVDEGRTSTAHLLSKPEASEVAPPEPAPAVAAPEPAAAAASAVPLAGDAAPPAEPRRLTPPGPEPALPEGLAVLPPADDGGAAPVAPRVLTTPAPGDGAAGPRVLTAPDGAPATAGSASPGGAAQAPPAPRPVLTTPPPQSRTPVPQAPPDSAGAPGAPGDGEVSESDEERLHEMHDWLHRVSPLLEAEEIYKAFDVAPDADRDEIVRRHRELVIKFHPDRFERFDIGESTEQLVVVWGKLNKAIVTLTDPTERAEYDIYVDRKRRGLPTDVEAVMRAESTYMDGERLLRGGRFQEALAKYDEAISLNKAEPEFHVAHAWTRLQIAATAEGSGGMAPPALRDRAREACLAALKEIPRLDRAHHYLGLIAKMDGNAGQAREQFRKAVDLNANNVEAKRELRLLEMRGGTDGPSGGPAPAGPAGPAGGQQDDKGGLFGRFRKP